MVDDPVVQVPQIQVVEKTVEGPQLQIVEKTAKTPETQITQGTKTFQSMGTATARQVVEIEAYLPAESASPMFGPGDHIDSGADSLRNYSADRHGANRHCDSVKDTPVAQQSLLPTAKTAQKTEEIPQVRHIDKVVGVPVVEQRQAPTIQTEQKTIDVSQIQCLEPLVDVLVVTQQTTEIPVVMLKQVPTLPQVQYNHKEVEVPVMVRRQIPLVRRIQKMEKVPRSSTLTRWWTRL